MRRADPPTAQPGRAEGTSILKSGDGGHGPLARAVNTGVNRSAFS